MADAAAHVTHCVEIEALRARIISNITVLYQVSLASSGLEQKPFPHVPGLFNEPASPTFVVLTPSKDGRHRATAVCWTPFGRYFRCLISAPGDYDTSFAAMAMLVKMTDEAVGKFCTASFRVAGDESDEW
nr:hypothetical protein B0A51_08197 [Rachicladosporium sp. CCFEE 5018]